VALSAILLLSAALFGRTLDRLHNTDLGFDRSNVYLIAIDPPLNGLHATRNSYNLNQRILDRIRTVPELFSAGMAPIAILGGGGSRGTVSVEGYTFHEGEDRNMKPEYGDARISSDTPQHASLLDATSTTTTEPAPEGLLDQ